MIRPPLALLGLLLALGLAACSSPAADRGAPGSGGSALSASPGAVATSPAPGTRIWGAGIGVSAEPYGGFTEWSRGTLQSFPGGAIALVRVVDVSKMRFSTASGEAPTEREIEQAGGPWFTIGRLVTVERVRTLRGAWPVDGPTVLYWLPGGRIEDGRTPTREGRALPDPRPDMLAVVATFAGADVDESDGVLRVNVIELFPVDASGRVATLDEAEQLTLDTLDRALPSP